MVWVRLADDVPDHPKILAAGPLAAWLWVCGLAYCNRHLTDGFLPSAQVRRLADVDDATDLAARLVEAGLWKPVSGGYRVHDFADYQPSARDVKRERKGAADRTKRWRERQKRDASSDGVTHAVRTPSPARPGPGPRYPVPDPAGTSPSDPPPVEGEAHPRVNGTAASPSRAARRRRPRAEMGPYVGGCPAGCGNTHGGPGGERELRAIWSATEDAGEWPDFALRHGRRDLAMILEQQAEVSGLEG